MLDVAFEEGDENPREKRRSDGEMGEDEPGVRVHELEPAKDQEQRHHQDDRRQHLTGQHEQPERQPARVETRKGVSDQRRHRERNGGRADRDDDAVREIGGKRVGGEQRNVVAEMGRRPFGRQLVGGELVRQPDAEKPAERQDDGQRKDDEDDVRSPRRRHPCNVRSTPRHRRLSPSRPRRRR